MSEDPRSEAPRGPPRLCPMCDRRTDALVCPTDGAPTILEDLARDQGADEALGSVIAGRWEVVALLGEGASGRVYRALEVVSREAVAVKLLRPHHARDRVHVRRFYREARAAMRLDGEHVVRVLAFGVDDASRTPYIVMEEVQGETLKERLVRGPLRPEDAREVGRQIARALVVAAREGIVHRDLKPANILVLGPEEGRGLRVKVADFGVAKDLERGDTDTLTAEGAAVGTPAYMAPEQVGGGEVGPSADLYALGCVLFEALAGRPPFAGGARAELYVDHLLTPAPPLPDPLPSGAAAPPDLVRLVARLLDKEPARRPADAGEVALALGSEPASPAWVAPRRRWRALALALGLGGAAAGGAVALGLALGGGDDTTRAPAEPVLASGAGEAAAPVVEQLVVRGGAATVRLHQGAARAPVVTGDARLVTQEVEGARLTLAIGLSSTGAAGLTVDVWSPAWRGVKVTGAATLRSAGPLEVDDASFNIAGSARADLEVRGPSLTSSVRGSSDVVLRGRVTRHEARTGGAARLDAAALETDETALTASGTSDATVAARARLELRNDGTGEIRYLGAPADLTAEGAGIVRADGQAP